MAGLLLTGLTTVVLATPAQAAQQPDPSAAAERELKQQASGEVTVRRDDRGVARFVGAEAGKPVRRPAAVAASATPARQAAGHLQRYDALWALDKAGSDVRVARTHEGGKGSVVKFQQTVDGMPVVAGELAVAVDADGDLQSVTGETTPLSLPDEARTVSAAEAQRTAVALAAREHEVPAGALRAGPAQAFAYDPALLGPGGTGGTGGEAGLRAVWRLEVTGPADVRHAVLVDRARGTIALHYNQVTNARVVCDYANQRAADGVCASTSSRKARAEGDGTTGITEVDRTYDIVGHTSDWYADNLGVDLNALIASSASDGTKLRASVRFCVQNQKSGCPMVNAFWNGVGIYLGNGFAAADDVVAHELSHGVVEKTADLAYWYQSGAINESMADVFGELVDLNNPDSETETPWLIGEGSPIGTIRSMSNPAQYDQPDRMTSSRYHAEPWNSPDFDSGGVHFNSGVGNKAAYLIARPASDGAVTFNGQTITGIGHAKAARVYFESLQLLTSGADYADLYGVLPQACANLAAGGVGGITVADCQTVSAAVTATEMNKQPATGKAPEAPVCDTGTTKKNLFTDGFEGSLSNWSRSPSSLWVHENRYARSGKRSLYGLEPAPSLGEPTHSLARLQSSFRIPHGVKTYLRFDHQYLLYYDPDYSTYARYYAGAVLTYSLDGGKTYKNAATLPWSNGPTRTIRPVNGSSYQGFGGDSRGFQSSRVDVSSLAGRSVVFRWRVSADPDFALDGWTLDNVNLYLCGGPKPGAVEGLKATGGLNRATVRWQPPVWPGTSEVTKYRVTAYHGGVVAKNYDNLSPSATSQAVSGLSSGRSYKFTVRAYNASGSSALSKTLYGTKIYSSLSPTTVRKGQTTKFSGKLARATGEGVRGVRVYLQGRPKGSSSAYRDLTSRLTSSTGGYSFTRTMWGSWQLRVQYKSGGTTYLGSTSAARTVTAR